MDLVVTTPGVQTAPLRAVLDRSPQAAVLVFDRATRCGSTTVDPTLAVRIRLAVVPCAVSLHAANRVRRRFEATGQSVDGVVISGANISSKTRKRITDRFDCSVAVCSTAEGDTRCSFSEYHE